MPLGHPYSQSYWVVADRILAAITGPEDRFELGGTGRQFLTAGLFGGFTTFATFSLETMNLIQDGDWWRAAGNIVASVALCLIGVWTGHILAETLNR